MVIDFHTHVFPDKIAAKTIAALEKRANIKAFTDGSLAGLLDSMEKGNIDTSIVLPVVTSPTQFDTITHFAQFLNDTYQGKIISFGGIHPDSPNYREELKTLAKMGFKGIKLHPDYQQVNFNAIEYKRIVSLATELGMAIVVHAGTDVGYPEVVHATPQMSAEVIKDCAPDKLVLAHYGGCDLWDDVENYLVGQQVYFDTSFSFGRISDEQFLRILKNHGANKVVFATDSPWMGQKECVEHLEKLDIDEMSKNRMFFQNALDLLE